MTTTAPPRFDAQVTDFERAPWLPVTDLARERAFLAGVVACAVDRGTGHLYADYAHDVVLMRDEDLRIGQAYRDAYQAWNLREGDVTA